MALSGINSAPVPEDPKQGQPKATSDNQDDKFSIFDKDKDGVVTIEEQHKALLEAVEQDEAIKKAVAKGFELDWYIKVFSDMSRNLKTNTSEMVAEVNKKVQHTIDIIKSLANRYLSKNPDPEPEQSAPTKMGKGWGMEDEHTEYIINKLQEKGIEPSEINNDLLVDIMAAYDYDMDPNLDGTLTTDEMNQYNDGVSHNYMNKDEQGNIKDTKVLDWMINKYIEQSKQ